MPRLGKRAQHLKRARDAAKKQAKVVTPAGPSGAATPDLSTSPVPSLNESDHSESSDTDFDPEEALRKDPEAMLGEFTADWVESLPRDDLYTLALLLFHILTQDFQLLITAASKIVAKYVNRSPQTVEKWRVDFLRNEGELPDFLRGTYARMNCVSNDEDLTMKAREYVRENAFRKGSPNMTAGSFASWVNNDLLPNATLESGAPRKISVEVGRKWLHSMGFQVKRITKGIYYDGHERQDVIEARESFLKKMVSLGFLHSSNSPSPEMASYLPEVELSPDWENTIFWFHDETTFNANDDQKTMWKDDTIQVIKPKSRGSGIMVSDFIEERQGYLALSDSMHSTLASTDPTMPKEARRLFEYGHARDGYWNNDHFMQQMEIAVKVAEAKYPPRVFKHVWIFDHSCGHTAFAPDALVASRLNKKPGGAQPAMRDTVWAGKVQKLVEPDGTPKGVAKIFEERGINTSTLKLEDMQIILANHDDFKNEKNALDTFLEKKGHTALFLPKFHCEFNGIERVWGHSKRTVRAQCDYTLPSLRTNIPKALDSVSVETIQKYIQRSRHYMFAFLGGSKPGTDMEKMVKKLGKEFKSHRRVGVND